MTSEITFGWKEGFPSPKGVTAEVAAKAIIKHPDPAGLLEASKKKTHCFNNALWLEGDQIWASRARLDYCGQLVRSSVQTEVIGGVEITSRVVEFIRLNGKGVYMPLDDIRGNKDYIAAYFREVRKLQEQAMHKMLKLQQLMEGET